MLRTAALNSKMQISGQLRAEGCGNQRLIVPTLCKEEGLINWRWAPFEELSGLEVYELLALRQAVFSVEQDCAYLDADGRDIGAWHLQGREAGGRLIACLRLLPPDEHGEATLGRVVTHSDVRGQGLGRALMLEGIEGTEARYPGRPIHLSAQQRLQRFYESLGFAVVGPGYLEDGIPHVPMRRGRLAADERSASRADAR
jgi:ElaA protein